VLRAIGQYTQGGGMAKKGCEINIFIYTCAPTPYPPDSGVGQVMIYDIKN
jgi:hypothetical protein